MKFYRELLLDLTVGGLRENQNEAAYHGNRDHRHRPAWSPLSVVVAGEHFPFWAELVIMGLVFEKAASRQGNDDP